MLYSIRSGVKLIRSLIMRMQQRESQAQEDKDVSFRTATAKSVYQWIIKPQIVSKASEMFLPGRMAFVYDMENGFTHDIPTTFHRSKADCPVPEEMVTVSVDGSVLDRIAKIMAYLRLGSSGKVLKKKKKEKDPRVNFSSGNGLDGEEKSKINSTGPKHHLEREMLPPPPPPLPKSNSGVNEKQKQPPPVISREEDDDIFLGEGVEYAVPTKETNGSPVPEDMTESPRLQERQSYFEEPVYGPVPPSEPTYTWQPTEGYDATQAQMAAAGYAGADWSAGYQYSEQYAEQLAAAGYAEQYLQPGMQGYDMLAGPVEPLDPQIMTQEQKDRGLGSVFKRDDERLLQMKEKDIREKDPSFISESYSECYPGYQVYNHEVIDSDDEADLTKMDMGGRAKGRLHRWDFETEEEWATYNEQKEAMPKAAFQFGVKMQDGRKTRKQNKDQKLTNDLHKINKILARKKAEKDGVDISDGGGGSFDDDMPSSKKSRV
ncbi:RED family protein isoform X2 [Carex rostrata]